MGTFYHTTNYNPLTGDLNNMAKPMKPGVLYDYNSGDKTFKPAKPRKVAFKEEEEDDSKYGGPGIPDPVDPTGPVKWVGKPKKKSKKA